LLEVRCDTIARARNAETLFAAVVDAEAKPLLLLALAIENKHGLRALTFLDGGLSDYNAPVVFAAARDWSADDVGLVWRGLQKLLPPFDVAIFEKLPERVGDLPNPLMFLAASAYRASGHATTLSGTWKDFAATRLPHRQDSRRQRRRLEERGKVTFEIAETPEQLKAFLDALIRQKTRRHLETLGVPGFDDPGYRDFITESTLRPGPSNCTHLSVLKLDKLIIAAHFGYVVGSQFYYLIPSYEGGPWSRFSPGRLLLEHLLQWSFAHGIRIFDFGIGDEEYKFEYCDVVIKLHTAIMPITAKGHAYALLLKMDRKLRTTREWDALKPFLKRARMFLRLQKNQNSV